ncbi:unnamed protein product [Haemonchus placei]|uniref:Uncharacterized protein n=1 Tax=Haemonchus placei TaxID=6290 RepID=A0A0N4W5C5_HAEPC|nr:unnamed protein product [Haemonchus placei]
MREEPQFMLFSLRVPYLQVCVDALNLHCGHYAERPKLHGNYAMTCQLESIGLFGINNLQIQHPTQIGPEV